MLQTEEITASFRRFGPLVVDWPHKAESKSYFPPKGSSHSLHLSSSAQCLVPSSTFPSHSLLSVAFIQVTNFILFPSTFHPLSSCYFAGYAFLLFQDESSVQSLIDACISEDDKLYLCVSSPTIKDKPVSPFPSFLFHSFVPNYSLFLNPTHKSYISFLSVSFFHSFSQST